MKYFIANLAVHLLISLAIIIPALIFADRNRKRKTKYVLSYFLPTILALLAVAYIFHFTGPRLLDLSDVATQNYYSYTGVIDDRALLNNTLTVDGAVYYINPLRQIPPSGSKVKVRYTRYCRYVISVEEVDEIDVSDSMSGES